MPVSERHEKLVLEIINWVQILPVESGGLAISADCVISDIRYQNPPRINGHIPDVYAHESLGKKVIIGEAKTPSDLEQVRTKEQLSAFLKYLANQEKGILVIATPWVSKNSAREIIRYLLKHLGLCVEFYIIDSIGI